MTARAILGASVAIVPALPASAQRTSVCALCLLEGPEPEEVIAAFLAENWRRIADPETRILPGSGIGEVVCAVTRLPPHLEGEEAAERLVESAHPIGEAFTLGALTFARDDAFAAVRDGILGHRRINRRCFMAGNAFPEPAALVELLPTDSSAPTFWFVEAEQRRRITLVRIDADDLARPILSGRLGVDAMTSF